MLSLPLRLSERYDETEEALNEGDALVVSASGVTA